MKTPSRPEPSQTPHEIELHARRIERITEGRKLAILKTRLQTQIGQQSARAS